MWSSSCKTILSGTKIPRGRHSKNLKATVWQQWLLMFLESVDQPFNLLSTGSDLNS
jgi:hypothetical protein